MKPLVSICIPTYNGAKYIRECIDSILSQTYTNFELIIVDDCSSDDTLNIAKKYATKDPRIRLIVNKCNLGLVGNWNRCVELARGEWIKFVFQDDLIAPNCLKKMLDASQPDFPIIACRRNFLFEKNTTEETKQEYQKFLTYLSLDDIFSGSTEIYATDYCQAVLNHLGINFVGEPTAVMLNKKIFYRFGVFNPHLFQLCDFEFWTRVAIHTGLIYVPENLATFRIHNEATSSKNKHHRHYRTWLLDSLIFLHDLTFSPDYLPLRNTSQENKLLIMDNYFQGDSLISLLSNKAYNVKRMAERAANDSSQPDLSLLNEWNNLLNLYPIIGCKAEFSLVKRLFIHGRYRWRKLQEITTKKSR